MKKHKLTSAGAPELETACDQDGRVDLKILASVVGEPLTQLAKITPLSPGALRRNPKSPQAQASARRFLNLVCRIVENTGSLEYTVLWLHKPHAELGNRSPLDAIEAGYIGAIENLIHDYEVGQPG